MFERKLFSAAHAAFRDRVRQFIAREITPYHADWERQGEVPRAIWRRAGEEGLLCCSVPREYGGPGLDYLHNVVFFEELAQAGVTAPGFMVHVDMVSSYIVVFGSEAQKRRWLPPMVRGEAIGALGMTEPHAGSDLKSLRTRARRDGDDYVIDGQKTFISNGQLCDFVILAAKTDAGARGISLIIVEAGRAGFVKGRKLPKLGLKGQDTSELFFEQVRVPVANRLGDEGGGFAIMMTKLAQERLAQAIRSAAVCEAVLDWTRRWVGEHWAGSDDEERARNFEHARYKLAELSTDTAVARVMTDRCIEKFIDGTLDDIDAAMVKMYVTQAQGRVVDECVQIVGEEAYLWRCPLARAYADARITRIAGGAIEVMKHIIGRQLVGRVPRNG